MLEVFDAASGVMETNEEAATYTTSHVKAEPTIGNDDVVGKNRD